MTSSASANAQGGARGNAMLRASVAGYVDAFSLLKLKVFTSFMSGNTTSTGMKAGQGRWEAARHDLLPIPCFVLGTFLGAYVQKDRTTTSNFQVPVLVVLLLLLSTGALLLHAPGSLIVMLLAVSMGLLNTTVAQVAGQSLNTGFVTGDLKSFGEHLAYAASGKPVAEALGAWDTQLYRAGTLALVWGSFLLGAVLGGYLGVRLGTEALLVPAVTLLGVALTERRSRLPQSAHTH